MPLVEYFPVNEIAEPRMILFPSTLAGVVNALAARANAPIAIPAIALLKRMMFSLLKK